MSESLEIRRSSQPLAAQMNELTKAAQDGEGWTNERKEKFDKLEKEFDSMQERAANIEREEKARAASDAMQAGIDEARHAAKKAEQTKNIGSNVLLIGISRVRFEYGVFEHHKIICPIWVIFEVRE